MAKEGLPRGDEEDQLQRRSQRARMSQDGRRRADDIASKVGRGRRGELQAGARTPWAGAGSGAGWTEGGLARRAGAWERGASACTANAKANTAKTRGHVKQARARARDEAFEQAGKASFAGSVWARGVAFELASRGVGTGRDRGGLRAVHGGGGQCAGR
ncbi:hypothetical protein EIP86_000198 [Pleurotus ostreatoroseus]|nr:hypothetical protein EIP86_000198 [Pleurotus ostreatoroseus]